MIEYFVQSASSFAGDIDNLFLVITLIIGFWFILTFGILVYLIIRFRRKEGVKAKYIAGEKHSETKWTHYPHYAVIAMDVVIIAVNILVKIPQKRTTANPRIGPVPNCIKIMAARIVVTFASTIVVIALE